MNPSSSSRCSAGKSEPGLTTNVWPLICWMRSATPTPCRGSSASVLRMRKSSVPLTSSACRFAMARTIAPLLPFDIDNRYLTGRRITGMRPLAALAIAGVTSALIAQEPQTPRFRVAVDAVRIDAVVTDKDGNVVRDLTADDFEILQDGKKQNVTFAQFVPVMVAAAPAATPTAPLRSSNVVGAPPLPGAVAVRRENVQ